MTDNTEMSEIESNLQDDVTTPEQAKIINNEPEYIPESNPWNDAPTGVWFYDIQYEDGHFGNMTQSAERAYKRGWDLSQNIPIGDVEVSDVNGFYYPKDLCPMKTEQDHLRDQYRIEIQQLKKQLSDTDYKAIKYAEGELTAEEYAPDKEQRAYWRQRINLIQQEFNL